MLLILAFISLDHDDRTLTFHPSIETRIGRADIALDRWPNGNELLHDLTSLASLIGLEETKSFLEKLNSV